jgi:DNA-binding response OmpR family regulator
MGLVHYILIVDDDPEVRDALAATLKGPGFYTFTAGDAFEAVRVLAERAIDVMIIDVRMPMMSGFELARQVKLMRPYMHMIFITGFSDEEDAPLGGALLRKPFRPHQLMEAVRRELELEPKPPAV